MNVKMLAVAFVFSVSAVTVNAATKELEHAIINNDQNMLQTEKYWTEEKMNKAIPLPLPEVSDEKLEELLKGNKESEKSNENQEIKSMEGAGAETMTPGVPVQANVSERPFWNGGKLFFTKPDGKDYSCTAEFVGQNNILLTAAHCVRDGETGAWYKNFIFRRAYSDGGGQKVGWSCAMAYYMWAKPPMNFKYDYAFIHTNAISGAGWLGWKTQIPYTSWTAIGYPQNYGSNQYMYKVDGDKGPISSGVVQMNNNPMNFGASGGSWIAELTTPHVGGNYAVGLNSFISTSNPGKMWGPLFDNEFVNLYNKSVDNCKE